MNTVADTPRAETAVPKRTAVSLYVVVVVVLAAAALAVTGWRWGPGLQIEVVAFMLLAALTDLKEIRLPGVGVVTLSFVPVLAALMVFGLWAAMLVAAVSGLATVRMTRDPQKVAFNVGDYVLSTFAAGLVYMALVGDGGSFVAKILPAYVYSLVDFVVATALLAGVISLATGQAAFGVWRENYKWGVASYLAAASLSLLIAWLYVVLGLPGLVLGLPPLYIIYYSYEVYVARQRERESHGLQVAGFQEELQTSARLHEELSAAQAKVAAEIARARRIQLDLLPQEPPNVAGLQIEHRIEFLDEMGGDYFDYVTYPDGRLGILCGDVMGKGLAAALIMAMARSVVHDAAAPGTRPADVFGKVNDALARDLESQKLPYFLTAAMLLWDPSSRRLSFAGAGHTPVLMLSTSGVQMLASQGPILGVRGGLEFHESEIEARSGDVIALYTDGLTEARSPSGELFGVERLSAALDAGRTLPLPELVEYAWSEIDDFRAGAPSTDDATLVLIRLSS